MFVNGITIVKAKESLLKVSASISEDAVGIYNVETK